MGPLELNSFQKLTFETDVGRMAFKPSIVKDQNGRLIVFYQKQFNSGKLSGGEISNPSGFNISISNGNGELNGISKSWTSDSINAAPDLLQLLYVDPSSGGNGIFITSDLNMTLMASVIPLAFIFSGNVSIVGFLPIENNGNYIVARRQKSDGMGGWIWDNYEDILNSGEDPSSIFNPTDNRIYITYRRNSSLYLRIIEVGNESNAWNLLQDYNNSTPGQLTLNDVLNELDISTSSLPLADKIISTFDQTFNYNTDITTIISSGARLSNSLTEFGGSFIFEKVFGTFDTFTNPGYVSNLLLYLPLLKLSHNSPIFYFNTAYYEIYDSDNETLLESIPYYPNIGTWKNIDSYIPNTRIFLGFRGSYSIFKNGSNLVPLIINPSQRLPVIVALNSVQSEELNQLNVSTVDLLKEIIPSALSLKASIDITFIEISSYQNDNTINIGGSIMGSALPIKVSVF